MGSLNRQGVAALGGMNTAEPGLEEKVRDQEAEQTKPSNDLKRYPGFGLCVLLRQSGGRGLWLRACFALA